MAYSRRDMIVEQQEAQKKAQQLTSLCEQLNIILDPIDWQQYGMQAPVKVNTIEIASLLDLSRRQSDDILRQIQIKLFERAALEAIHARLDLKASVWSPIQVVQPQPFLNLWIITLETGERVPIAESIKNGQRVYEHYQLDVGNVQQLASLFGSAYDGEYQLGDMVTIKERDHQFTGEIAYILPPDKTLTNRKASSRGYHTVAGTAYTNDKAARYIVDCHDGFPHVVNQSQVVQ